MLFHGLSHKTVQIRHLISQMHLIKFNKRHILRSNQNMMLIQISMAQKKTVLSLLLLK